MLLHKGNENDIIRIERDEIMKALITGASSGIGRDMAKYLSKLGYDLVIVARNEEALENLKNELKKNVVVVAINLNKNVNFFKL